MSQAQLDSYRLELRDANAYIATLEARNKLLRDECRAARAKAKGAGPHTCQEERDDCRACRISDELDAARAATDAAGAMGE